MTAPGTRRPRKGRCERCDRPLTDLVWTTWTPISLCGPELQPVTDWLEETPTDDTRCYGEPLCGGDRVDWRARALAAESRLSVPATSADTTRLHRIRARLLELVPADGTMSLWDDVQRLDRALADAEARGRAHGLLAAAWRVGSVADVIEGTTVDPAAQRAMREAERLIVALATEANDA